MRIRALLKFLHCRTKITSEFDLFIGSFFFVQKTIIYKEDRQVETLLIERRKKSTFTEYSPIMVIYNSHEIFVNNILNDILNWKKVDVKFSSCRSPFEGIQWASIRHFVCLLSDLSWHCHSLNVTFSNDLHLNIFNLTTWRIFVNEFNRSFHRITTQIPTNYTIHFTQTTMIRLFNTRDNHHRIHALTSDTWIMSTREISFDMINFFTAFSMKSRFHDCCFSSSSSLLDPVWQEKYWTSDFSFVDIFSSSSSSLCIK